MLRDCVTFVLVDEVVLVHKVVFRRRIKPVLVLKKTDYSLMLVHFVDLVRFNLLSILSEVEQRKVSLGISKDQHAVVSVNGTAELSLGVL